MRRTLRRAWDSWVGALDLRDANKMEEEQVEVRVESLSLKIFIAWVGAK